jgi:DNA-directed RNA polymerase
MTEPLLTQMQNEERMFYGGIKRAEGMMAKAEEQGRAHQNPYAKELFRDYVLPLAAAADAAINKSSASLRQAHSGLLRSLDLEAVAFLTIRTVIGGLLHGLNGSHHHRALAYDIGRTIHHELVLAQIEDHNPALYHTLAQDFQRRMSKDERHRMTVFKQQARDAGIIIVEWPRGARDQVGLFLLGLLEDAGLVELAPARIVNGKTEYRAVTLSPSVMARINEVKEYVALTMPVYGPCVEPPKDWVTPTDGGFHSRELRRTNPALVRASASNRALYREANMPKVLAAVNALQRTAWAVNTEVLDTVVAVAASFSTKEIVSLTDQPKPAAPEWLATHEKKAPLDPFREEEFKAWKRKMTTWYEERKLLGTKYGRFYSATRSAEMFRAYPSIYFVHFADSRGRLYPMTYGLNPQGSDLQKALLRFSQGKPLDTPQAIRWFHVQGANKWGFDKATLEERQQWVVDRQDLILSFATDPLSNTGWREADSPLQFLAWCFEYRKWVNDTTNSFLSHLPISMDGSCNGLQNLSALLRDEIGGQATNLIPSQTMEDIYARVALATTARMEAAPLEDTVKESLRQRWLAHGINRSLVKRSVMTTPYGVTHSTAASYVISDYLAEGKAPCFEKSEWRAAAGLVMSFIWPAIGDVVVKGREAMVWLKKSARVIVKESHGREEESVVSWDTPSGFPASQCYYEAEVYRIKTRLHGQAQIRILSETDEPDLSKHASGLAPNFVHSMDAAHLHLTTAAASALSIDALAMIHDDYGTHAADAQKLFELIREQFVWMYENHDPISALRDKYPMIPAPPERGTLDIRGVLQSTYFFS